jgi:cell wall-associated NlpC family hydrolase
VAYPPNDRAPNGALRCLPEKRSMNKVSLSKLDAVFRNMRGRVLYDFGGKAADLDMDSHGIEDIDCSGFVRFALHRAGGPTLPDGSVNQHAWCEEHALYQVEKYSDLRHTVKDKSRLFICFIPPKGRKAGHVWLVRGGFTYESHGGVGVDARKWNTGVLYRNCTAVYELETAP